MVPPDSHRVSRAPRYSGYCYALYPVICTGLSPSTAALSSALQFLIQAMSQSYNPGPSVNGPVWANARSLAATSAITVVFSSSGYLDVSVHRVRPPCGVIPLHGTGLPHSEIRGSIRMCRSPRLIAAYRVLRRLWEPRHSPCALDLLVVLFCS